MRRDRAKWCQWNDEILNDVRAESARGECNDSHALPNYE